MYEGDFKSSAQSLLYWTKILHCRAKWEYQLQTCQAFSGEFLGATHFAEPSCSTHLLQTSPICCYDSINVIRKHQFDLQLLAAAFFLGVENLYVSIETTVTSIQAQYLISKFRLVQQSFWGNPLLLFGNDETILLRFFGDTLSVCHSDDEEPIWQQLFSSLNC